MDPLVQNIILLSPLFLGFILSQFLRMNLKGLQGIYFLLAAGNVVLSYFILGEWLAPLVIAAAGFVVLVVTAGFLGERVRPSDYMFFEVGVGLFPWMHWGFIVAIAFAVVLVMFAVLVALRPKFKNPFQRRAK